MTERTLSEIEVELTAPGGFFELERAEVLGATVEVFKHLAPTLRVHLENSLGFGAAEYLVVNDGETERRFTFQDHHARVTALANRLVDEFAIGVGDRVGIVGANSAEWIATFWATVSIGAIAVAFNGWWSGSEIEWAVGDAEPKVLFGDRKRLARIENKLPCRVVEFETEFEELWRPVPGLALPPVDMGPDDPALILYTSGTSGRPKGAVHSHRNINTAVMLGFFHGLRMMTFAPPSGPHAGLPNVQLATSPLFHVSGLHMGAVTFLVGGTKSVWLTGRFDPELVMQTIERERCTGWSFTPTMLSRVVHHPEVKRYDLSTLRTGGGGGAPFAPELLEATRLVIPGIAGTLGVGYGMTECSALATLNPGPELPDYPRAVGRPLPGVEIRVVDDAGHVVAEGTEGEIELRGPGIMLEYWRNPEATGTSIREDRWLRTGDIGTYSEGRLSLSTRRTDLILRGGENVYPTEIEHRLEAHPQVSEAAVIGVPDDDLGQRVKAIVVGEANLSVAELSDWCAGGLASFKVPAEWEFRSDPLPRNAAGKVRRAALIDDDGSFMDEDAQ